MIRIGIVEDNRILAETLKEKLELFEEFQVKFMSKTGKELLVQLKKDKLVDVLIMDINMPDLDGITSTQLVKHSYPQIKVIMCTVYDDEKNLFEAIRAGANGYLLKDQSPKEIKRAIYECIEGGAPMNPVMARKALQLLKSSAIITPSDTQNSAGITKREREVLEQLASGLTYEQTADNLIISYGTVRKHVENIYRKLAANNKQEAILKAKEQGLI